MEDNGVERTYGEIQVQTGPNDYLSKSNSTSKFERELSNELP
jgi:hypothetical protein